MRIQLVSGFLLILGFLGGLLSIRHLEGKLATESPSLPVKPLYQPKDVGISSSHKYEDPYGEYSRFSKANTARRLAQVMASGSLAQQDQLLRELLQEAPLAHFPKIYREIQAWLDFHEGMFDEDASGPTFAAYETLAEVMIERDPVEAMNSVLFFLEGGEGDQTNETGFDDRFGIVVFRKWVSENPERAAAYLNENNDRLAEIGLLQEYLTTDLAKLWVKKDLAKTLQWIEQMPEKQRDKTLRNALLGLYHQDPESAGELLKINKTLAEREPLAAQIAFSWAEKSAREALYWAASLDPEATRSATMVAIDTWATSDLEGAVEAFQTLSGPARDAASRALSTYYWDRNGDHQGAAELLEKEEGGPQRNSGIRDLIANWSVTDPEAAGSWLNEILPEDDSLDEAVSELGVSLFTTNPQSGADWLASIRNPERRQAFLSNSLDGWFRDSPDKVLKWIEGSEDLSDLDRSSLSERYEKVFEP